MLPALLYFFPFYYMAGFKTGAAYAAVYCFTLVTFSCVVGAMSMSVTGTCGCHGCVEMGFVWCVGVNVGGVGGVCVGGGWGGGQDPPQHLFSACRADRFAAPLSPVPPTVASNTAGQASFAMNFLLLFSLVFTGFLVKVSTIPSKPATSSGTTCHGCDHAPASPAPPAPACPRSC